MKLGLHRYKTWKEVRNASKADIARYESRITENLVEIPADDEELVELLKVPKIAERLDKAGSEDAKNKGDTDRNAVTEKLCLRIAYGRFLKDRGVSDKDRSKIQEVFPKYRVKKTSKDESKEAPITTGGVNIIVAPLSESKAEQAEEGAVAAPKPAGGANKKDFKSFYKLIRKLEPKLLGSRDKTASDELAAVFPYSDEALGRVVLYDELVGSDYRSLKAVIESRGDEQVKKRERAFALLLSSPGYENDYTAGASASDMEVFPKAIISDIDLGKVAKGSALGDLLEKEGYPPRS
jgi:hypothetical protein